MSVIRVCFLGTPDFAAEHLKALLADDHYEVVCVVTQPDRPRPRKMQLTPSPVKLLAINHKIEFLTPENLKKETEILERIKSWKAEVAVVVAFGQILNQEFLDSFTYGAVNVHGSLLPLWRGAAPIQRSIEAGDTVTGVSLQKIVKKLDAGPVIGERKLILNNEITAKDVYQKLSPLGCDLLKVELMDYIRGNLAAIAQDEALVSFAAKIEKEESLIHFNQAAQKIHNKVRAFNMGPGTYIQLNGQRLKIHKTKVIYEYGSNQLPGSVHEITNDRLVIQTADGLISLLEVQPESKNKMLIGDFLKSVTLKKGDLING